MFRLRWKKISLRMFSGNWGMFMEKTKRAAQSCTSHKISPFFLVLILCDSYNVYGGNQDLKAVFGDVERFLRYDTNAAVTVCNSY